MSTPQIRLKTEDFRAINTADIVLNGITVVAGENGCGKSTLSKLLYYLYKTASNFEDLVATELNQKLRNIIRFIEIVISDLNSYSSKRNINDEYKEFYELRDSKNNINEGVLERWVSLLHRIENNYYSQPSLFKDEKPFNPKINIRLKFIVKDLLQATDIENDSKPVPFDKVISLLEKLFKEAIDKIKDRPTSLFLEELSNLYSDGGLPSKFEVFEFDDQIVSIKKRSISIPYTIQNSIYIDTPMMLGLDFTENEYWDDLNELLRKKGKANNLTISHAISEEIIDGDISPSENSLSLTDFSFERKNGEIYNLLECATGVKSLAILQILLSNGSLTNKTLLIIDEPESHLHPQWIIEYARIIVLLNKEIGVKFFIASHNPDMVSAIKYIAEKEGIEKNLNFYLAEKVESNYKYDYKSLGVDIEPIFKSFNIAIDRINKYGI